MSKMFYHHLTFWRNGVQVNQVIGSSATNIDEAYHERTKIAAQYNPHQIIALTTHTAKDIK